MVVLRLMVVWSGTCDHLGRIPRYPQDAAHILDGEAVLTEFDASRFGMLAGAYQGNPAFEITSSYDELGRLQKVGYPAGGDGDAFDVYKTEASSGKPPSAMWPAASSMPSTAMARRLAAPIMAEVVASKPW